MSLDKAIKHKKEHRKVYHGAKSIDKSCRNHGACKYCEENRKHKNIFAEKKQTKSIIDFQLMDI